MHYPSYVYSYFFCSPHQWARSMSLYERLCPSGERLYLESGVSFSRIHRFTNSTRRSVNIFVFASPILCRISVNDDAPLSTAWSINITHFFPRRAKRDCACGQVHWGDRTIQIKYYGNNIMNFFFKAKYLLFW